MHPRNKYKTPPNFTQLACIYPDFLSISTLDLNGSVKLNFKDSKTLKILTKCLLHHDFDLDVDIPDDRLVPTVPLRLNYLLWIEDLLNAAKIKTEVLGIDIGTGSCCIYPLLAAVEFKWKMIGTESDNKSAENASKNVSKNNLEELVTVKKVSKDSSIFTHCFEGDLQKAHFSMCNPPFYSSLDDMNLGRNPSRPPPKNAHTGSADEIITPGGEISFVKRMIDESVSLKDKIIIYTTMLGHKNSLKLLLHYLDSLNVKNVSQTTFRQGRTTRWGLAWSYVDSTNLKKEPLPQPMKHGKPMSFMIPPIATMTHDVENVTKKIIEILNSINVKCKVLQKKSVIRTMEIKAEKNTWSNQRKKRRMENNKTCEQTQTESVEVEDDELVTKKAKFSNEENMEVNVTSPQQCSKLLEDIKNQSSSSSPFASTSLVEDFITAAVCVRKCEESVMFEIGFVSGAGGKDSVHQIVQFIKNNWK